MGCSKNKRFLGVDMASGKDETVYGFANSDAAERGAIESIMEGVPNHVLVLLADAHRETCRAMQRFPQPNYVITKVAEEAGEVVKAAIHCAEGRDTVKHVRDEIKQAIAMLLRLYLEGDQIHGLPPIYEKR